MSPATLVHIGHPQLPFDLQASASPVLQGREDVKGAQLDIPTDLGFDSDKGGIVYCSSNTNCVLSVIDSKTFSAEVATSNDGGTTWVLRALPRFGAGVVIPPVSVNRPIPTFLGLVSPSLWVKSPTG